MLELILDQEISPELVPVAEGERPQSTEDTIGPYALHDFTLFHVLRYGFPPSRIAFLAEHAWSDAEAGEWPPGFDADRRTSYDLGEIRHWLEVFCQRFFAFSQFKRSAIPNGPKVLAGRLAVAARRLARTVRRQRPRLAGRAAPQRPRGLSSRRKRRLARSRGAGRDARRGHGAQDATPRQSGSGRDGEGGLGVQRQPPGVLGATR